MVAVNKMDLVNYDENRFNEIVEDYIDFADKHRHRRNSPSIPISALNGENIITPSDKHALVSRQQLLAFLEDFDIIDEERMQNAALRLPVQWVNRPDLNFRGFSGTVSSGIIQPGDDIRRSALW